jgi:hypothetical protein
MRRSGWPQAIPQAEHFSLVREPLSRWRLQARDDPQSVAVARHFTLQHDAAARKHRISRRNASLRRDPALSRSRMVRMAASTILDRPTVTSAP